MYPVDLHIHTVASTHAYSTLNEYITRAKLKGIKLLAITDHGPNMIDAPHKWHFMNMNIWPRVIENVGILRGIEANIKNIEGDIDCIDTMLDTLDLIIAGFHEPVFAPKSKDINTCAMISTISKGKVHIISHPGNPKFPIDIWEVAKAANKHRVALEINNSSFVYSRKGSKNNCRELAMAVKDIGGMIALGSDSHTAFTLGEFSECKKILEEVNFPEERILNLTPKKTLKFLESRGMIPISEFSEL